MVTKYARRFLTLLSLSLIQFPTLATEKTHLIEGTIDVSEPTEVAIVFDCDGDQYVTTLTTDAAGRFIYDHKLPCGETDVLIFVAGTAYGAYVSEGSTTVIDIKGDAAAFSGDNTDESRFYNAYQRAFYPMQYKPSPDVPFVYDDYKKKLDNGRRGALEAAASLSGKKLDRATRLVNAYYDNTHIMLLGMQASYNQADSSAVIDRIIAAIDPDADESRLTGLINHWYNRADIHRNSKAKDMPSYLKEQYAAIDSALVNEGNKKSLYYTLGSMFMMYQPSDADIADFYAAVEPQLAKAPMVKQRLEEIRQSMAVKVKDGDSVPTDPVLISPEGTKSRLSDILAQGKIVYIDIWATWCGPCCREIPFMEKLVERFNGNDGILFVSISRDDNRNAWLKKLERDNPSWPQYIFDKATGDEFMDAMSINGIPRFLLIDRDGRFIKTDAQRPSDSEIDSILDSAIAKK